MERLLVLLVILDQPPLLTARHHVQHVQVVHINPTQVKHYVLHVLLVRSPTAVRLSRASPVL